MSDVELERRVAAALRAPVALGDGARDRIMRRVREASLAGAARRRASPLPVRAARHSIVGLVMAASVGSLAVLSAVIPHSTSPGGDRSAAIGDSIVEVLRDTLLLTRLLHDGEHRFAFAVDGARWMPDRGTAPARADRMLPMLRAIRDSN